MLQETLAVVATCCVSLSYVPQIVKGYRTKSLDDISYGFLSLIGLGVVLWLLYGFAVSDFTFLLANTVILLWVLLLAVMKWCYRK